MSSSKIIVLKSSDGETFEVEEAVALESQTIKPMIETPKSDDNSNKTAEDDVKAFDAEFVKVDQGTLFDLILEKHLLGDQNARQNEKARLSEPIPASVSGNPDTIDDAIASFKDMPAIEDETDTLSDIDDVEVNCYLNNEEESRFKKIIWEEMNKEYLQEQAAKEAAAAAARKIYSEASDDVRSAQELAAAAAAAVARSRETRRQKRAEEAKKAGLAQTAAEATRQMLTKKRLSSKINYDVLDKLFDDSTRENQNVKEQNRLLGELYEKPAPTTKKNRADDDDNSNATGKQLGKKDKEVDNENFDEQDGEDEDMEGKYGFGEENNQGLYGNEQEMYDYNYDDQDGYDEY